jgi:hypothetical protein
MTATQMVPAIGQIVRVRFEDLKVTAKVVDVKTAWGRPRLQIEPVAGEGRQWIELGRVVELVHPAPEWAQRPSIPAPEWARAELVRQVAEWVRAKDR